MIETRKREHSRKPDEQYPFIEACSPGPYLEMFARHPQPGWTAWGDESGDEVTPRGQVHRGYTGGEFVTPVKKHQRLTGEDRELAAKKLRAEYDAGASIRDRAAQSGYSIQRVRTLLKMTGELRPPEVSTSPPDVSR
ncbi:MT-A70 family methyltransferase [Gordonia paraffinivorans]|uniref:MT-A70 family methyltransferase n=1 Tax=Gordonia paraffinivorans TaxID=175628 RepID=UPI00242EE63C|nr:MT-A70 family methyltransferase [Gordonia paraffinivorans]